MNFIGFVLIEKTHTARLNPQILLPAAPDLGNHRLHCQRFGAGRVSWFSFFQIFGGMGDGYDLQVYGSFLNMCYAQRLRIMSIMRMMRMRRIMMTKTFCPSPLNCPSITRNYWLRKLGLQGSKSSKDWPPRTMDEFSQFFVVPSYCAHKQHHKVHEARDKKDKLCLKYFTCMGFPAVFFKISRKDGIFWPATKETNKYLSISMHIYAQIKSIYPYIHISIHVYIYIYTYLYCLLASNWNSSNILMDFNPEDRKNMCKT